MYSNSELAELIRDGAVHRSVYTDPEIFELEMRRIWGRAWIYVAHESQIPLKGSFFTTTLARQPVLLVRQDEDTFNLFFNRCAHKGAKVIVINPTCAMMLRREYPELVESGDRERAAKVAAAVVDPSEMLWSLRKDNRFNTDFKSSPGEKIAYHAPCHQRVQNMGQKTREILDLVPETKVQVIERCSGHDGTYAVKKEFYDASMKIVRPVAKRVKQAKADHYGSDCPMAGQHIGHGLSDGSRPEHPLSLLRLAYGI